MEACLVTQKIYRSVEYFKNESGFHHNYEIRMEFPSVKFKTDRALATEALLATQVALQFHLLDP